DPQGPVIPRLASADVSEPRPLPFVGPGPDRAAQLRDEAAASAARKAPTTRVIPVGPGPGVVMEGGSRLARLPLDAAPAATELTLLGVDADGGALFAFDADPEGPPGAGPFTPLRDA